MLGKIIKDAGVLLDRPQVQIIKKSLKAGESIPEHSHHNHDIYFTLCYGKAVATLEGEEKYELSSGEVLEFKGDNSLSVECLEDSEILIVLLR